MAKIPENYLEKVYAGWLAKIIGIRLGAAVEGWTYQRIREVFGELTRYPAEYKNFAADDDSNGPLFFLRALEDKAGETMTAQDVGEALMNYAPWEHGFFWWGGYGVSTEHTAYLNLRNGIKAPQSGSIAQNGAAVAEQIGGQIFIDTWGLVAPGNPDLAADLAEKAASVTHGGNGVYGGIFVAVCVSLAFVETDIQTILEKALSFLPSDCEYVRVVRAVMAYHRAHPERWRDCFEYIYENFGYDKYPGACHIIPNIAVMILALLYGNGDFSDTLNICNMCGWDTDCNVGNVATIMGVRNGIAAIDPEKWMKPIKDLLICSSVIGSLNIQDIPYGASYIAKLAYRLAGETPPGVFSDILENRIDSCHFEFPESTHAMRVRTDGPSGNTANLFNSDEYAYSGKRSLKVFVGRLDPDQKVYLYKKTYYTKDDFSDSRYDPSFSPLLYPGQTVTGKVLVPECGHSLVCRLYARDDHSGETYYGPEVMLEKERWYALSLEIPALAGARIGEAGFCFTSPEEATRKGRQLLAYVDDLCFAGEPSYTLDFSREREEIWSPKHREITQLTRLKGWMSLTDGQLALAADDYAEVYTGRHDWKDYRAAFTVTPVSGDAQYINFRMQGAIRSYAAGFDGAGKFKLLKNVNGYLALAEADFDWKAGESYVITVSAEGSCLTASVGDVTLSFMDTDHPYLCGSIGLSVHRASAARYGTIAVNYPEFAK